MSDKKNSYREKLEQMSEKELLLELTYEQQQASRRTFHLMLVGAALVVILLIVAIIIVPKTVKLLNNANTAVTEATATIAEVKGTVGGMEVLVSGAGDSLEGIDVMVDGINAFISDNTDALTESIAKINQIDFEKLNTSIGELQAILEPLANFFNIFHN